MSDCGTVPATTRSVSESPINWQQLAEERIRAAQDEGRFANLTGFGRPIPGIDEPHDELWWIKQKLKEERLSVLPPALAIRRDAEKTLARIAKLTAESQVRAAVVALNDRIRKTSFAAAVGPSVDVMPLDVEAAVAEWKARRLAK